MTEEELTEMQKKKTENNDWSMMWGSHVTGVDVKLELEGNEFLGEQLWIRLQNVIRSMDSEEKTADEILKETKEEW